MATPPGQEANTTLALRSIAATASGDRSLYALVGCNVLALAIGAAAGLGLRDMMLVYWIQSVVIGAANVVRILNLDRFDPSNFKIDGKEVDETPKTKRKVAFGFLVHYGIFHLLYLLFVATGARDGELGPLRGYLLCALVFAVNHGYSLVHNLRRDAEGRPSIGALMFMPYVRIVPMHLTIVFGGLFFGGAFAFFLFGVLKTAADALMHTIEHHVFQTANQY